MANAVFTYTDTVSYAGQVSQRCIRNLESTIVTNMAGRTFIWFRQIRSQSLSTTGRKQTVRLTAD
jgi:hypothetical protein